MHASIKNPPSEAINPIGYRLRMEMKKRGITSAELSKRADVKTSFIYDIISGKSTNPSTVKLARVAMHLGVSLVWLVGGNDNHAEGASASNQDYVAIPRLSVNATPIGSSVVSQQQSGEPCYFSRQWIADRLGASVADMRLLSVRGDSMEPTLSHNDSVLIDTSKKVPSPPGIFVLFDGFALVVKRLEYLELPAPARLRVISDNPQYSTYERTAEEAIIIGRVVWFARET